MSKLAILLCVAVFASAANASSWSDALESVRHKVVAAIDATIHKFKDTFEAASIKAEQIVRGFLKEASNLNKKIKEKVEGALKKIEEHIAELSARANDVNVTECTKLFSLLEFTGLAIISNMSMCVTDHLHTGTEYVENLIDISENVLANLTEIRKDVFECGNDIDGMKSAAAAIQCVNDAATEASHVRAKVVPEMSVEFGNLKNMSKTLKQSLVNCTLSHGLATLNEESGFIIDRMNKCIQQKISKITGNLRQIETDHH